MCLQGLGLFAARDLEKHTMVIEYIGQLIRNEVAEMREKIYEKQVNPDLQFVLTFFACYTYIVWKRRPYSTEQAFLNISMHVLCCFLC